MKDRRSWRRRRRAAVSALAVLGLVGLLLVVEKAGPVAEPAPGGRRVDSPVVSVVGRSDEGAWWLTPQVSPGPGGVVTVSVPTDVLFAVDSADVGPSALAAIAEVARLFELHAGVTVSAACYTDATGTASWNLSLSEARARAVAAALVSAGVPDGAVSATGYGATKFVADNAIPTGRALNRRCQFTIYDGTR